MKIIELRCKGCKEYFPMIENESTRGELEDILGTEFTYQCTACLATNLYHINDTRAIKKTSIKAVVVFALALIILLLNIVIFSAGVISLLFIALPFTIYSIYSKNIDAQVSAFNKLRINRTTNFIPKKLPNNG